MNRKKILLPLLLLALLVLVIVVITAVRSCRPKPETEPTGTPAGTERSAESSGSVADDPTKDPADITGTYEITAMVTDGKATPPEDLELMKSKGLSCTVTLRPDGTGILNLFGEESAMVWDTQTISTSLKTLPYTFADGELVIIDGASSLTFTRP